MTCDQLPPAPVQPHDYQWTLWVRYLHDPIKWFMHYMSNEAIVRRQEEKFLGRRSGQGWETLVLPPGETPC